MYHVEWIQSALNELARIWTQGDAALREALTAATNDVDSRLRTNPNSEGESRPNGLRITFVFPLAVTFAVTADDRNVTVVGVHLMRRRNR